MKIAALDPSPGAPNAPLPPARCAKIRGRRRRQCVCEAAVTIEYRVTRRRVVHVHDERQKRLVPMVQFYDETHRWAACRAHAQRARRHGATVVERRGR